MPSPGNPQPHCTLGVPCSWERARRFPRGSPLPHVPRDPRASRLVSCGSPEQIPQGAPPGTRQVPACTCVLPDARRYRVSLILRPEGCCPLSHFNIFKVGTWLSSATFFVVSNRTTGPGAQPSERLGRSERRQRRRSATARPGCGSARRPTSTPRRSSPRDLVVMGMSPQNWTGTRDKTWSFTVNRGCTVALGITRRPHLSALTHTHCSC